MQKLTAVLRQYSGNGFWVMTQKHASANFAEQADFGKQVAEAFTLAGWKKVAKSNKYEPEKAAPETNDISDRGCLIAVAAGPSGVALMKAVSEGFKAVDIDCESTEDYSLIPDFIFIENRFEISMQR